MLNNNSDTIAAIATPPGRGGVAIIRVSGPLVRSIMQTILKVEIPPRHARYLPFLDANGHPLDEGIVLFFPHPHSFTGEDIVEFQGHGGPMVMDLLLQRILQEGVRLARPGEFSERAFLNGKIDLVQAEAIADLIDASSVKAARLAFRSLQGVFSKEVHALTNETIHLRMYIEAAIDFVDEEIDFLGYEKISDQLKVLLVHLTSIQSQAEQGSLLREGIRVVIVGAPNVGKSTLLNALSGKELAIVTPIAGTTRDVIRDHISLDGIPIHIMDTAGLRESGDVVEQEGMRRARLEMQDADVLLYLCDATTLPRSYEAILKDLSVDCPVIIICNKIDLLAEVPSLHKEKNYTLILLSAKEHQGIDLLKESIKALVGFHEKEEGVFLARRRHLDALVRAKKYLMEGEVRWQESQAAELLAEDLRKAQMALSEITGEFSSEDLLGKIFASFCIGK